MLPFHRGISRGFQGPVFGGPARKRASRWKSACGPPHRPEGDGTRRIVPIFAAETSGSPSRPRLRSPCRGRFRTCTEGLRSRRHDYRGVATRGRHRFDGRHDDFRCRSHRRLRRRHTRLYSGAGVFLLSRCRHTADGTRGEDKGAEEASERGGRKGRGNVYGTLANSSGEDTAGKERHRT